MSDPSQIPPPPPPPGSAVPPPPPAPSQAAPAVPAPPPAPSAPATPEAAAPQAAPAVAAQPDAQIIQTDSAKSDGLVKCERCGATDIALNVESGKLRCNFCRHEWLPESAGDAFGINGDIGKLTTTIIGSGSSDIQASVEVVVTFKCGGCGAEVVIDTASSMQARCHWCRNKLSVNEQIPNGAVPDVVLPFSVKKDAAVGHINDFVKKRMTFAHPKFKAEFNPENVMGVYLPYMVVDMNAHAAYAGQGEHETRRYTVKHGDSEQTRYDADVYQVGREFDIHINDLTVESSTERLNRGLHNTNNVINTIMPFDVENSVRYDANFLAGFTSERRDTNIADLMPMVTEQAKDIARLSAHETLGFYDRGVRWDNEQLDVVGQRWIAAYLPVWLYSYHQDNGNGNGMLHYVAVNGRTGETMGSVPLYQRKLLAVAAMVEVIGIILAVIIMAMGG